MMDVQAPPTTIAAWVVAGMLGDALDVWMKDNIVYSHGPQSARERWDGVMRAYKVPLKVYLALEVYPGEAR